MVAEKNMNKLINILYQKPTWLVLFLLIPALSACSLSQDKNGDKKDPNARWNPETDAGIEVSGLSDAENINPPNNFDGGTVFKDTGVSVAEDAECASSDYKPDSATRVIVHEFEIPVSIYIMLDVSASMLECKDPPAEGQNPFQQQQECTTNLTRKWDDASNSLNAFVNDPSSAGLNVAIQFFPLTAATQPFGDPSNWFPAEYCSSCEEMITPWITMASLPDNATPISSVINDINAAGGPAGIGTPLECAIRGLSGFCAQYSQEHTDEKCIAVLITDGLPIGCSSDYELLASIAEQAGVKLYAVGMTGADMNLLELVAQRAGTNCTPDDPVTVACDISQEGVTLQDAMNSIRETERIEEQVTDVIPMECEWVLPEPDKKEVFDKDKVNLVLSEPGKNPFYIPKKLDGQAGCTADTDGWYYDNEDDPKPGESHIKVCDFTCNRIKNVAEGQIKIELGCKPVVG